MILSLKKIMISSMALVLVLASLAGCSKSNAASSSVSSSPEKVAESSSLASSSSSSTSSIADPSSAASQPQDDTQQNLLVSMKNAAEQGKVIQCEFPVKTKTIEDVEAKWGKEDKSEYIASAKGTYAVYNKQNITFGFNKGSQLFEVRSYDSQLKSISLSKVKDVLGKPDHDVKSGTEEIIGYVINSDYKILMVFPNPTTSGEDPKLDHYSVFYPRGTVNMMADDAGRQW